MVEDLNSEDEDNLGNNASNEAQVAGGYEVGGNNCDNIDLGGRRRGISKMCENCRMIN